MIPNSFPRHAIAVVIAGALAFAVVAMRTAEAREWKDATGKYRVEAELIAIRGDKVILERDSGEIVSVPIERLCNEDQIFLATKQAEPSSGTSNDDNEDFTSLSKFQLADRVSGLLKKACHRCHGEDGTSEGGFNFVIDLPKLAKSFAEPGEPSLLLERITTEDDSMMPPVDEEPRLSPVDISLIKHWVKSGSPARPTRSSRKFVSNEMQHLAALKHLKTCGSRDQRFIRFFSLVNLYNAGVSEDELQTYRNAFGKLLNSLSWNRDLVVPESIDESRTLFAVDIRDLNWQSEVWESLEAANPYHMPLETASAIECYDRATTTSPVIRIDWFVFAASRPPLYHAVLGLPQSDRELEDLLHVHVESNIRQEKAIRCGFNRSGVSQNNRLIEWHPSSYGSYWKSYDFGGNVGRQNLFEYPMGPGNDRQSFQHDGGEIIFTLPNGLQAYLLVDAQGKRIDQGPVSIVSDPKRPDRTVTNGVSCMSCHYTGVIPKRDEVGVAIRANPGAYQSADDILALYRESKDLERIFDRDGKRFSDALEQLGIRSLSRGGESVSAMAAQFERDIDLIHVAAEFGLNEREFRDRLTQSKRVARSYSPLLIPGGVIKRDMLRSTFVAACIDFKLVSQAGAIELNRRNPVKLDPEQMTPSLELLAAAARNVGKSMAEPPNTSRPDFGGLLPGTTAEQPQKTMMPSATRPNSSRPSMTGPNMSRPNPLPSSRTPSTVNPSLSAPSRMSPRPMTPSQRASAGLGSLGADPLGANPRRPGFPDPNFAAPVMPAPTFTPRSSPMKSMRSTAPVEVDNPNDLVRFGDISWGFGGLCFSPDAKRLIGGHKADGVTVFDIENQSVESVTKLGDEFRTLGTCKFSEDGKLLLIASQTGLVACCTLDAAGRPKMIRQFAGHSREVTCMDLSKDGRFAASGSADKRVRYWETRTGRQKGDVLSFERTIQAVRISPSGETLWATDGKTLTTYDLKTQQITNERPLGRYGSGQSSAISFDGAVVAVDDGRQIKLWEIKTGRQLPSLETSDIQWAMQFMPDRHILVSGGRNMLSIWDVDSQQRIAAETFNDAGYMKVFDISRGGDLIAAHCRREVIVRQIQISE